MSTLSRRHFLGSAAAGTLAAAMPPGIAQEPAPPKRPNIIWIMADDLGYGDLGCYGQQKIKTPRLDQMAAEGMRFTQCYAGSTVCAPSRCALMTGLHMGHAFVRGNARLPLRPEDTTVAEVLKQAGYATALIGKWGLGNEDTTGIPNRQGFDYFFGYLDQKHAHNYYPEFLWRNEEQVRLEGNVEETPGVASQRGHYTHDLFAQEALQFVEKQQDGPFFLYLSLTIPHANNERGNAKGDGMEVPDYAPYTAEDWPEPQKGKAAMITRMDRDVGRLLDKLHELGIDGNTLVFFTSDNGPHKEGGAPPEFFDSNGPLRGIKRDLYEGGIRVPMIARWPGVIAAGSESDFPWAFWDFLPTAAELAAAEHPNAVDGLSVAPLLLGRESSQRQHEYLYWEFYEGQFKQAVRRGDWKAVRLGEGATELYNLREDLAEEHNLAGEKPELVEEMETIMAEAHVPSEHWQKPVG